MQKIIEQYKDHQMDESTQKELNKPLKDDSGLSDNHKHFLESLIQKLENGSLDVHLPRSLYNHSVYDSLDERVQEKVDLTAINLMSMIRQIESLWKMEQSASFQIQNLIETIFQMKSKFEKEYGDVFII